MRGLRVIAHSQPRPMFFWFLTHDSTMIYMIVLNIRAPFTEANRPLIGAALKRKITCRIRKTQSLKRQVNF
jgi:hypothetical protein